MDLLVKIFMICAKIWANRSTLKCSTDQNFNDKIRFTSATDVMEPPLSKGAAFFLGFNLPAKTPEAVRWIPDFYVPPIEERLTLYKQLDGVKDEEELDIFRANLIDRFGPVPAATEELIQSLRLRWQAQRLGFEKLILKFGKMVGVFTGSNEADFFQSEIFGKIIETIKAHPNCCEIKERKEKLTLVFEKVGSVKGALERMNILLLEKTE